MRVAQVCHVDVTSGHFGVAKTVARIKERFMWNDILSDVKSMIAACDVCQKSSGKPLSSQPELHPVPIHCPITPALSSGNRFILTLSDYYTKWVDAVPLPSQWLRRKMDQTLKNMIVKFVYEKKEDWDVYIDCHVFAYNTAKHASSLYSPFEVMFGRKAVLPIELSFNDEGKTLLDDYENHDTQQDSDSCHGYLTNARKEILENVNRNVMDAQRIQKRNYSRKRGKGSHIGIGDKIEYSHKATVEHQESHVSMQENHTVENDSNSHESAYEDCSGESEDEIMQYEDSVSQPNAIDNATLQEQLYSSSLLRLWRSGACTQIYDAEEDDEYFDETLLKVQDGEYALSKDLSVSFWTEFREYYGYTSLREVFSGSFIIVNDHLHDEFKQFSKNDYHQEVRLLVTTYMIDNTGNPQLSSLIKDGERMENYIEQSKMQLLVQTVRTVSNEIELLSLRSKLASTDICSHHEQEYLHKYSVLQRKCCNVFDQHKDCKPRQKSLREITRDKLCLQKLSVQVPEEFPTLVDLPVPGPSTSYLNEGLPLSASTESTSDDSVVHGVDIEEVIHYLNLTPVKLGKVEHFSTNRTIKETQRYHRYVP
ncbi:hypothetical protein EMCRGX_G006987 [Ephydatia muelleri]